MDTKDKKRRTKPAAGSGRSRTAAPAGQRRTQSRSKPDVQVVYTQPKPFNRNRFLLGLATVVAVVLALIFGMSIFFKVENVVVYGAEKYTAWQIKEASGIQEGDNLLSISDAKVSGKITTKLPYVNKVRVGIKLPDTVNIEIIELDVTYAVEAQDGSWWLMDASGKIVDKTSSAQSKEYTRVLGVQLSAPQIGSTAVAAEPGPETDPTGEEVQTTPVTIRGSERLSTAVSILQYLEDNGVIGQAASVDVTDMGQIELWYGDRYQVNLGDTTQLSYKIKAMKAAIDKSGDYQSGVLDVSFTTWPDKVGFTPFTSD